ncbi:Importin subunit alpha-8, partial [Galemys pyrenaicus]
AVILNNGRVAVRSSLGSDEHCFRDFGRDPRHRGRGRGRWDGGGGGIQPLIGLLSSLHMTVCEQAIWALGNIAGDGPQLRDIIISSNAVPHLLAQFHQSCQSRFSETSRGPCPTCAEKKSHTLVKRPTKTARSSRTPAGPSYLTYGCNELIGQVVDTGVLPWLEGLITSSELNILTPSLCILEIGRGTDGQTQVATDASMLHVQPQILMHPKSSIQKEGCRETFSEENLFLLIEEISAIDGIETLQFHENY